MSNLLTVVIPCKNEGIGLVETILSIKFPAKIIVADCSTDDTREILRSSIKEVQIIQGGLPSVGRNAGAKLSKTKYTLFIDADMDISEIDLESLLKKMETGNLDLLTCQVSTRSSYKWVYRCFSFVQKIISPFTPFAVGGFMLIRTEKFISIGGFDERDKFAEDFHLSLKIDPKKFSISNQIAFTSDRRLRNKSVFYMANLMIRCWFNRKNPEFYQKDYGYWQ